MTDLLFCGIIKTTKQASGKETYYDRHRQNQVGTFIAQCRKEKKLTQKQLGEKLNVTDRAVSKWETGRSFPDVSLMEPLCQELDISVSELLAGKRLEPEQYQKETEKMLMASVSAGQLMGLQVVLYVITLVIFALVDFPFVIRKISGLPLVNYISIACWILALVLIFSLSYLDKNCQQESSAPRM